MGIILTEENYYTAEANKQYMSVSQFKDLIGTLGVRACEAAGVAKINGIYREESTTAILVGSYVDAYFEGTVEKFKKDHPEIFVKDGSRLLAQFTHAEKVIKRIESDDYFMSLLSGEKQKIITFELFGVLWKAKIDSWLKNATVDLKVMKSLRESHYTKEWGKMNFVQYWGYDIQATIYREGRSIFTGEKRLPFVIAAASKEDEPDIEAIGFTNGDYVDMLSFVENNIDHAVALKNREIEPIRCEKCPYCKATKKLSRIIHHSELIEE